MRSTLFWLSRRLCLLRFRFRFSGFPAVSKSITHLFFFFFLDLASAIRFWPKSQEPSKILFLIIFENIQELGRKELFF